jgi:hypothetical protein
LDATVTPTERMDQLGGMIVEVSTKILLVILSDCLHMEFYRRRIGELLGGKVVFKYSIGSKR